MALVSIIIPAHNAEEYLKGAIHSLLRQTYPWVEIIIVDDGSTDGTAAVVRGFGNQVRSLYQVNAGPSAARNAGLARARGKYVTFLDADDQFHPERIEILVRALEAASPNATFAVSDAWLWDGTRCLRRYNVSEGPAGERGLTRFLDDNRPYIGILARREALVGVGGFRQDLWLNEDLHLWLRLLADGNTYVHVPEPLYLYRVRHHSLSRKWQHQLEGACQLYLEALGRSSLSSGQRRRLAYLLWRDRARLHAAEAHRARAEGQPMRRIAFLGRYLGAQSVRMLLRPHFTARRLWSKRNGEPCVLEEIPGPRDKHLLTR